MNYPQFEKHFSPARANRYLVAAQGNPAKAVDLYKQNLKVAQAFHPLLGIVEVVLRNHINDHLALFFSDTDWIINQKNGFMSDPSLEYFNKKKHKMVQNHFLRKEVEKAEKQLKKKGVSITAGKIIAEQTFGFWSELFEKHYYRILKGRVIQIFSDLPKGYGRKEINRELDGIRRFRNRINHNEPICFKGTLVDFTEAAEVYQSIINILQWIEVDLPRFFAELDSVNEVISTATSAKP
jgi:hypothetical protein